MAINKNFIVKNGLEVGQDIIFADADNNKVGIGTSIVNDTLYVNGGIGATNLRVSGVATIPTLNGTTANITSINASHARIVSGVITSIVGTSATYSTANISNIFVNSGVITSITGSAATITQINSTNLYSVVGVVTNITGEYISYSGISTFGSVSIGLTEVISGSRQLKNITSLDSTTTATIENAIANAPNTFTNLVVTGVTTLGVASATNFSADNLNISGIGTITNLNSTNISAGIVTATSFKGSAQVGFATGGTYVGLATQFNFVGSGLNIISSYDQISGIATLTFSSVGATGQAGISSIGIQTAGSGGPIGSGATILDFRGAGISTVTVASGIATIFVTGGGSGGSIGIGSAFPSPSTNGSLFYHIDYGRTFVYYDEVALGIGATAVWVDSAPFNQGGLFVSKFGDNMSAGLGVTIGSLTNPSIYFNGFTNSGFYSPSANQFGVVVSGSQILNVNAGGIRVTGVATATDFDSLSDVNYKENITIVNNALMKVEQLRGVKFDWKETGLPSYGVIAQELEEVLPELVHGENPKTVNYNGIIGVLIEAIKELKAEVEELKNSK